MIFSVSSGSSRWSEVVNGRCRLALNGSRKGPGRRLHQLRPIGQASSSAGFGLSSSCCISCRDHIWSVPLLRPASHAGNPHLAYGRNRRDRKASSTIAAGRQIPAPSVPPLPRKRRSHRGGNRVSDAGKRVLSRLPRLPAHSEDPVLLPMPPISVLA